MIWEVLFTLRVFSLLSPLNDESANIVNDEVFSFLLNLSSYRPYNSISP